MDARIFMDKICNNDNRLMIQDHPVLQGLGRYYMLSELGKEFVDLSAALPEERAALEVLLPFIISYAKKRGAFENTVSRYVDILNESHEDKKSKVLERLKGLQKDILEFGEKVSQVNSIYTDIPKFISREMDRVNKVSLTTSESYDGLYELAWTLRMSGTELVESHDTLSFFNFSEDKAELKKQAKEIRDKISFEIIYARKDRFNPFHEPSLAYAPATMDRLSDVFGRDTEQFATLVLEAAPSLGKGIENKLDLFY